MPGLVPGIHVLKMRAGAKDVDGRDKPGHDDASRSRSKTASSPHPDGVVPYVRGCGTMRIYGFGAFQPCG
jgi:hypothetical protein